MSQPGRYDPETLAFLRGRLEKWRMRGLTPIPSVLTGVSAKRPSRPPREPRVDNRVDHLPIRRGSS